MSSACKSKSKSRRYLVAVALLLATPLQGKDEDRKVLIAGERPVGASVSGRVYYEATRDSLFCKYFSLAGASAPRRWSRSVKADEHEGAYSLTLKLDKPGGSYCRYKPTGYYDLRVASKDPMGHLTEESIAVAALRPGQEIRYACIRNPAFSGLWCQEVDDDELARVEPTDDGRLQGSIKVDLEWSR